MTGMGDEGGPRAAALAGTEMVVPVTRGAAMRNRLARVHGRQFVGIRIRGITDTGS